MTAASLLPAATSASVTSRTNLSSTLGWPPKPILNGITTQSKHAPGTPSPLSVAAPTIPATCEPWKAVLMVSARTLLVP